MLVENLLNTNKVNKNKSKGMLDISITNIDKISKKQQEIFLTVPYKIEEKFDGTKLTLWRNSNEWSPNYTDNWVVAFKHQILYKDEFTTIDRDYIRNFSVGISQYVFIHDHVESIHHLTKEIPPNTEFFIEFIQNKLTTTREYNNKHKLFLIAYSLSEGEIEGGMLKTTPTEFNQTDISKYSNLLSIDTPPVLFDGLLDSIEHIENGILYDNLKPIWENIKHKYLSNPLDTIKELFLSFDSTLGGIPEGVVMHSGNQIYKIVQTDQHDKSVRFLKKDKYQSSQETEDLYWSMIDTLSNTLVPNDIENYNDTLKLLSDNIYSMTDREILEKFKFKLDKMREEGKINGN